MRFIQAVCFFWVLGLTVAASQAQSPSPSPSGECASCTPDEQKLLRTYEKARSALKDLISSDQCTIDFEKSHKICRFGDVCDLLGKQASEATLYENAKGQIIPNYSLLRGEDSLKGCLAKKRHDLQASTDSSGSELMQFQKSLREHNKKVAELKKKFLEAIQRNGDEATHFAFEKAAVDATIEAAEKESGNEEPEELAFPKAPTREDHEKNLADLEKRTGKKYSKPSRELYLDYMTLAGDFSKSEEETKPSPIEEASQSSIVQNPFLNLELFTHSKAAGGTEVVKANQARFQGEFDRSFRIFEESRKDIIELIQKRATPENQAEVDAMVERIRLIRMEDPSKAFGECPGPNAFYSSSSHEFTLCPQIMQLPDASLKAIIVHELGHSIDPCNATSPLVEIEGEKKPGYVPPKFELSKADREAKGIVDLKLTVPPQPTDKKRVLIDYFPEYGDQALAAVYQSYKKSVLAGGVPIDRNPFASVIECLGSSKSMSARSASEKDIRSTIDQAVNQLRASGAADDSAKMKSLMKAKSEIPTLLKGRGFCARFLPAEDGGKSQVQEAFSDWLAGEVLGDDLKTLSPKEQKAAAFESVGFFAGVGCASVQDPAKRKVNELLKELGCEKKYDSDLQSLMAISEAGNRAKDEHPFAADRVNKIFFAHPAVKKALGCKGEREVRHCE